MKKELLFTAFVMSVVLNIVLIFSIKTHNCNSLTFYIDEDELCNEMPTDTLSDWQMFTLALMKVESGYDSTAVSSVGAKGLFQMRPIYVKEVNRVHNTDYQFEDVTDFNKSYEIFDLMQQAHNPDYDMKKAMTIHNGDHMWYRKRVYQEMEWIKKYENFRNRLKKI